MKNKGLKISVVILLIITLTMTNFIFLGSSLISYAVDDISTNNKNIEFSAYFNSYDNNADLIFYTSMFFFSYLIEKQKIVKDESFESKDFLKKAENLIDNESIASNIIAVMYDMKEK